VNGGYDVVEMHPYEFEGSSYHVEDELYPLVGSNFEAPPPIGEFEYCVQFARFPLKAPVVVDGTWLDEVVAISLILRPLANFDDLYYCVASGRSFREIRAKFLQHSHDDCELPVAPPDSLLTSIPDLDAKDTEVAFQLCDISGSMDRYAEERAIFDLLVARYLALIEEYEVLGNLARAAGELMAVAHEATIHWRDGPGEPATYRKSRNAADSALEDFARVALELGDWSESDDQDRMRHAFAREEVAQRLYG
jgi:hypothetical protein